MTVIQKEIKLAGSKGERVVLAVFDSGSTYSCITPELARELEIVLPLPEAMEFGTAKEGESLTAQEAIRLNFHLNGYRFSDEFMLIPGLSEPVIIGAKTLQAWRLKLNFETDEVIIDPRVTKFRLLCLSEELKPEEGRLQGRVKMEFRKEDYVKLAFMPNGTISCFRGCPKTSVGEPLVGSRKLGGDKPLPYEGIF